LVTTLAAHGFLEQNTESSRYRMGYQAFLTAQSFFARGMLEKLAFEHLRPLAERHRLCGFLGVRHLNSMMYLLSLNYAPIAVNASRGSSAHLHSTGLGKALLAGLPQLERHALLKQLALPKLTPFTIVDMQALLRECEVSARRGYTISNRENMGDLVAAGAWICDAPGKVIAAVCLATRCNQIGPSVSVERLGDMIAGAARSISDGLRGSRASSRSRRVPGESEAPSALPS